MPLPKPPNDKTLDKKENSSRFCFSSILEIKESDSGLVVKGYIATTHFDGQDKITKPALDKWAKEINDANPRANKVSVNHKRVEHVAGVGIKGSARIDRFSDGEYGLYAETLVDKTREDYDDIKYRVENNLLDSFSIEYLPEDNPAFDKGTRILDVGTELHGWTLASQPMNENAIMIKELVLKDELLKEKKENIKLEDLKMTEDLEAKQTVLEAKEAEIKVREAAIQKKEEEAKVAEDEKATEDAKVVEEAKVEEAKEMKKTLVEVKEKMDAMVENKAKINDGIGKIMFKEKDITVETKEYDEIFSNKELSVKEQFSRAGKLATSMGLITKESILPTSRVETREYKYSTLGRMGNKLQYKGLGITTNVNDAYVDGTSNVGISAAELQDIFDPVIINALNEVTNFYNVLAKDDKSMMGGHNVAFTLKTAVNASAGAYLGNAVGTGNTTRTKYLTQFKKYKVDFAVDGDMVAAARGGPIGDVVAKEIADAAEALLSEINVDLFTEQGAETVAKIIGLKYLTNATGNATLFSTTRSSTNKLSPISADLNYVDGSGGFSKTVLRKGITYCLNDGSMKENLIIVCDWTQVDKIKELYDNSQRLIGPTATRFGFETDIFFEGTPVLGDKDCPSGQAFIVDVKHHRIGMWVPPTVEILGKRSDAEEGFIKTYFAVYNTAPRRLYEFYSLPTS